eukprot:TRINITY_DN8867_c0_g1_i1.p1 TRINITY_DN8867_c0_g1~~TRINITY_DN8867_c0_g1_i1.p1  ORF type:complete len:265 (-),score=70.84 TRINITY_DN8867_c0_g1_i1:39-737(-)
MKDEVSIIHLISASRQFVLSFLNCMKFWMSSSCLISALVFTLYASSRQEPFLSVPEIIWLTTVFIPLLSLSLLGSRPEDDLMLGSTGKNIIVKDYRKACLSYGGRFLPSFIFLFAAAHQTSDPHLNAFTLELYLILISVSCLYPHHQVWRKCYNPLWILNTLFLLSARVTFYLLTASWERNSIGYWLTWSIGLPCVALLNEFIKYNEIKINVRHQKRARLDFGTKLGINSPF